MAIAKAGLADSVGCQQPDLPTFPATTWDVRLLRYPFHEELKVSSLTDANSQVHRLAPIQAAPQPVIEQVARTQFVEAAPIRQAPQLRTPKNIQFDDGTQFINNAPDGEGNYDFR